MPEPWITLKEVQRACEEGELLWTDGGFPHAEYWKEVYGRYTGEYHPEDRVHEEYTPCLVISDHDGILMYRILSDGYVVVIDCRAEQEGVTSLYRTYLRKDLLFERIEQIREEAKQLLNPPEPPKDSRLDLLRDST